MLILLVLGSVAAWILVTLLKDSVYSKGSMNTKSKQPLCDVAEVSRHNWLVQWLIKRSTFVNITKQGTIVRFYQTHATQIQKDDIRKDIIKNGRVTKDLYDRYVKIIAQQEIEQRGQMLVDIMDGVTTRSSSLIGTDVKS